MLPMGTNISGLTQNNKAIPPGREGALHTRTLQDALRVCGFT